MLRTRPGQLPLTPSRVWRTVWPPPVGQRTAGEDSEGQGSEPDRSDASQLLIGRSTTAPECCAKCGQIDRRKVGRNGHAHHRTVNTTRRFGAICARHISSRVTILHESFKQTRACQDDDSSPYRRCLQATLAQFADRCDAGRCLDQSPLPPRLPSQSGRNALLTPASNSAEKPSHAARPLQLAICVGVAIDTDGDTAYTAICARQFTGG